MALKGLYKFMGDLPWPTAYAVVDRVIVEKDGDASAHVSIYKDAPVTKEVDQEKLVANEVVGVKVQVTERGSVIEHFTIGGIKVVGQDPFVAAYEQLVALDDRLTGLQSA